jgi:hypothetical protein
VAKRTLEHPRQRQPQVSDSNGEEQQKADHKQRPARDYGVAGFFTEQKVRSDDSDDYVDKGKQALSSVHSRTAPPPLLWILAGRHNCRNIAISSVTAEQA